MSRVVPVPNLGDLVGRYLAGESLKQLSDESGYSRTLLTRRFVALGVQMRGQSDAERLKWRHLKSDPAGVERQLARAWAARRGALDSGERKAARAATRQRRVLHVGHFETELATLLRAAGQRVIQQTAVGPYNVDLAIHMGRIAVECFGSQLPRKTRRALRERTEYLLNRGWLVVLARLGAGTPLTVVAENLVALAQQSSGNETARRQYRVMGRDGQFAPPGSPQHDQFARILRA